MQITEALFEEILQKHLFPMFPGTILHDTPKFTRTYKNTVSVYKNRILRLVAEKGSDIHTYIFRTQRFSPAEKKMLEHFIDILPRICSDWNKPYQKDSVLSALNEFVARVVSESNQNAIQSIISILDDWASQTYEGQRISFSIGVDTSQPNPSVSINLSDIEAFDFIKVLGNGYDTILVINGNCNVIKHEQLNELSSQSSRYSPYRFRMIAGWSTDNKIGILLLRSGEILIFKSGDLIFSKRRGHWKYYPHESVISRFTDNALGKSTFLNVRKEVYLTALDAAFSHGGGCIGVVNIN